MIAKNKKKIIILAVVATVLVALASWIVWGNSALEPNTYRIASEKLPESFNEYRIV